MPPTRRARRCGPLGPPSSPRRSRGRPRRARQFEPCVGRYHPLQPTPRRNRTPIRTVRISPSGSENAARQLERPKEGMPMSAEQSRMSKAATRRKFLAGAAITGAAAVAMPQVSRAQTATLRMQTSWPATDIFTETAQQYIQRVNEMADGRLKTHFLHGGSVLHPFEGLDGVHGGEIDASDTSRAYSKGKDT